MTEQPKPQTDDITEAELQAIHEQVDQEIAAHGLPTADQIRRQIEALNQP
ncbi:MAG TPA: hypothetical protein PK974_01945 [Rhodocyclaceae bacterium]|nr:hypothetical protein [Rhodocyclaceae bacterium]